MGQNRNVILMDPFVSHLTSLISVGNQSVIDVNSNIHALGPKLTHWPAASYEGGKGVGVRLICSDSSKNTTRIVNKFYVAPSASISRISVKAVRRGHEKCKGFDVKSDVMLRILH